MKSRRALTGFAQLARAALPALAVVVMLFAALAPPAGAASLDELRQQGVLGERYDGYVVVRQNTGGAAQTAAEINAKRRALYAQRAQQQKISVDQVGQVYARQILSQAPAGTWFLDASNRWVQKQ